MIVLQVYSVCRVDLVLPNESLSSRFKSVLWFNIGKQNQSWMGSASPAEVPTAPRWLGVQEKGKRFGEGEAKEIEGKKIEGQWQNQQKLKQSWNF